MTTCVCEREREGERDILEEEPSLSLSEEDELLSLEDEDDDACFNLLFFFEILDFLWLEMEGREVNSLVLLCV